MNTRCKAIKESEIKIIWSINSRLLDDHSNPIVIVWQARKIMQKKKYKKKKNQKKKKQEAIEDRTKSFNSSFLLPENCDFLWRVTCCSIY